MNKWFRLWLAATVVFEIISIVRIVARHDESPKAVFPLFAPELEWTRELRAVMALLLTCLIVVRTNTVVAQHVTPSLRATVVGVHWAEVPSFGALWYHNVWLPGRLQDAEAMFIMGAIVLNALLCHWFVRVDKAFLWGAKAKAN